VRVYLGYDVREDAAYRVAMKTLCRHSDIIGEPLRADRLRDIGLYWRSVDHRDSRFYDLPSNAFAATEFATTRFLVPILCQEGWALFTDCDMLFLDDVRKMMDHADPFKAVMVVKHDHRQEGMKMDNQPQQSYPRKNWSSVMLFNCNHAANRRLTVEDVNRRPGRDLHRFYWLHDDEIGELPPEWNWLVGVQPKPKHPKIAHYTLGGPWLPNWRPQEHDDLWLEAKRG